MADETKGSSTSQDNTALPTGESGSIAQRLEALSAENKILRTYFYILAAGVIGAIFLLAWNLIQDHQLNGRIDEISNNVSAYKKDVANQQSKIDCIYFKLALTSYPCIWGDRND